VDPRESGEFAVALSGGGHRATLFAIGALLALVDRGLNRRVVQISSVSGGSIANAFVAQRCHFEQLGPGELDPIAAELLGTIVNRGVLTRAWIFLITGSSLAAGIAAGVVLWRVGVPAVVAVFVGLFLIFGVLLTSGLVVQALLHRRYFARLGGSGKLGDLADRNVEHVFCSTDLVLGQPVHFSSWNGGSAWRMTGVTRTQFGSSGIRYGAESLSLAEVVRASSAFPGIPPLRLRSMAKLSGGVGGGSPSDIGDALVGSASAMPGVLFLADGGLWSNLGSHVLREHHILRGRQGAGVGLPLLCVNSSAAGAASAPVAYSVPVVAQFAALFRTLSVLTVNTVSPRVKAVADAMARRTALGTRPGPHDPLDIVVDLSCVDRHELSIRALCRERAEVQRSDAVHDRYRQDLVTNLAAWAEQLDGRPSADDNANLSGLVLSALRGRPRGSAEGVGIVDRRVLDDLLGQPWWAAVRASSGDDDLSVPTTLNRVERASASELVLRGYANTWLSSLLLGPDDVGMTAPATESIVSRVRRMVGLAALPPADSEGPPKPRPDFADGWPVR
jgi:hypothetical protein